MIDISESAYNQMLQLTFSEYQLRMKLIILGLAILYAMIIILCFQNLKSFQNKLSKESQRKLKQISKWEHRAINEQVGLIIDMFIEAYTEKHKINWDEHLY